ncbi:PREDICTED: collagen alpha-1(XII) chain-like [Branchiostoma belcheri]|uniref:Collagen alpha-1(XII) chain-like n=1 Tax=Branchiostoma belcheri TaxID=7741 RepID=A0A6P4Z2S5_BRABE|nr:PREDICTED: collagen alpha-1(XII) chain-like [Branchiostoma belcheri]
MEITSRSFVLVVVFLLCIETSYCRYYTREVKKSLQNPLRYGETDIVFVLDTSGRVGGYNFGREVTFVRNLLNKINVYMDGAQVSLIRYGNDVDVLIHQIGCWPGSSKCELLPALSRVSYTGGSSNMGAALQKARELFESSRPGAKKVLVLLTDGHSDGNENPDHQATLLKATGVEIFTIGIGSYDYSELQSIASPPYAGVHVYPYNNFNDFNGLVLQIRGGEMFINCKDA